MSKLTDAEKRRRNLDRLAKSNERADKIIHLPLTRIIAPNPDYIYDIRVVPSMGDVSKSLLDVLNPFNTKTNEQINTELKERIEKHNDYVMQRARTLTVLEKMGYDIPPRLEVSAGELGGINELAKIIRPTNLLPELPEVGLFVNGFDVKDMSDEIKSWSQEEMLSYVLDDGPNGYIKYLSNGGRVIQELSIILDNLAGVGYQRTPGNAPIPEAEKNVHVDENGIITASPEYIASQSLKGRVTFLDDFIKKYMSGVRAGSNIKYMVEMFQEFWSDQKQDFFDIIKLMGIYIPIDADIVDHTNMSRKRYATKLANSIYKNRALSAHLTKAFTDLFRQLVDMMIGDPVKQQRFRTAINAIPMSVFDPIPSPVQEFDLEKVVDKRIQTAKGTISKYLKTAGYTDEQIQSRLVGLRKYALKILDEMNADLEDGGEIQVVTEQKLIQSFYSFILVIENTLKGDRVQAYKRQRPEDQYREYKSISRDAIDFAQMLIQPPEWANRFAGAFIDWLFQGGRPVQPPSGDPTPSDPLPDNEGESTPDELQDGNQPTPDEPQGNERIGIPWRDLPRTPIQIPYSGDPGEIDLREADSVIDMNELSPSEIEMIEKSAQDEGIDITNPLFESSVDGLPSLSSPGTRRGFVADLEMTRRRLPGGIRIRGPFRRPNDPDDNPYYEITIGGKQWYVRKKTLIWLLALLLSLLAALIAYLIERAIATIEGEGDSTQDDGDDPHSTIPKNAAVRNHGKIGGEAYVLGATDDEIAHNQAIWHEFTNRSSFDPKNPMDVAVMKMIQRRYAGLSTPARTHQKPRRPNGVIANRPRMRNIYQYDDYLNDIQEDLYHDFTRVMPAERNLSHFDNEQSIYHDSAYNKQLRRRYKPLNLLDNQPRQDGINFAPFSYATNGLYNDGNHMHSRQIELYPNQFGFPAHHNMQASVYKASKKHL